MSKVSVRTVVLIDRISVTTPERVMVDMMWPESDRARWHSFWTGSF